MANVSDMDGHLVALEVPVHWLS
jgi:hypothetical protein